jgi:hypothetical protein
VDNDIETTAAAVVACFQALWWHFSEGTKEQQTSPSQRSQPSGLNLILLLSDEQAGKAWEPSNNAMLLWISANILTPKLQDPCCYHVVCS